MPLEVVRQQFRQEIEGFAIELSAFVSAKSSLASATDFSLREECLLEGMLSRIWQSWCRFCRLTVVRSCLGSTTASGVVVVPVAGALSEHHISGAACSAVRKHATNCWTAAPNTVLRLEPMWGDVDSLNKILTRLAPVNASQLLAAFSAAAGSAKALQKIRNGAAHSNPQTLAEIVGLGTAFVTFPITHPTQALFWVEPTSSDFLVLNAIDELEAAAEAAVR